MDEAPPTGPADDVNFPAGVGGASVVDLNWNANAIGNLSISGNVTLTLEKDLTLTGNTSVMSTGKINGMGDLIIAPAAQFTWTGGTLEGDSNSQEDQVIIQANGRLLLNALGDRVIDGRNITNYGRIAVTAGNVRVIHSGQVANWNNSVFDLAVAPGNTTTIDGDANVTTGKTALFTLLGQMSVDLDAGLKYLY